MGARYAPSLANLYMGLWEQEHIFAHHPSGLRLWQRYIDNDSLADNQESFAQLLSQVNHNWMFTIEHSQYTVPFFGLDHQEVWR